MEIANDLKDLVRKQGFSIGMNTEICKRWKANHSNCFGCECEEGCNRYIALML